MNDVISHRNNAARETEADGEREGEGEKWAEAETEAEHEELRTFSNINTLAFVLKLWPGTRVAQTGLPIPPPLPSATLPTEHS